ncbi:phosphotransferase [Bacillus carboniphilus]|uniref:Phosphotransferase n=1 Tax=Bacillus carboniphilus TaxID=86663 RepID=A0ABP3G638_9BACI
MDNQYKNLIENALSQYGIYKYNSVFIRHNENITLKITDYIDNKSYLLRIHIPITPNLRGVQHTLEGLKAEMELLDNIAEQISLHIQKPIKNKLGSFVSTIIDSTNNICSLATLLTWVEGEAYTGNELNSDELAYEVGSVLARLHNFSSQWTIPQPFTRPVYDMEKYTDLTERLQYGIQKNLFTSEHFDIIVDTRKYIKSVFTDLRKTRDNWGIIHADLQGGNIIVHKNTVIPIDFGFSGYGYFLFDIGLTLASFSTKLRKKVLEGYKSLRDIDDADEQMISAGFILGIFGAFGFHINNPKYHEWIQRRIPYVAQEYCLSLLDKKSFILTIE